MALGSIGISLSILGGIIVLIASLAGKIAVPGYSAITIQILFFGGLSTAVLGIVGQYTWLCQQNARLRPAFIVREVVSSNRDPESQK